VNLSAILSVSLYDWGGQLTTLSDAERQLLIDLLESGESIPSEFKNLLFPPEKQEYELVYFGKQREEDVIADTMAVPLQLIRSFGNENNGWSNQLIFGDNLQVAKMLLKLKQDGVYVNASGSHGIKLIYIDPPFATRQEFTGSDEEKAYQDKVIGSRFIEFIRQRLILLHRLLAADGVICVHLDYRYVHLIRAIMSEIFGEANFRNEIYVRRGTKNVQSQFENISALSVGSDTLLLYSKSSSTRLRKLTSTLDEEQPGKWDTFWRGTDRKTMRYELFGTTPSTGQWRWEEQRARKAVNNYEYYLEHYSQNMSLDEYYTETVVKQNIKLDFVKEEDGSIYYYVPPRNYVLKSNMWMDVATRGTETNYPTEKHEDLLARIIGWLTDEGDIVLDAFAGSGTTLAVAEKLGRRWIGIDCGKLAIYTIQKRILNAAKSTLSKHTHSARSFELYNAGLYDFSRLKELPWSGWRSYALGLFQCKDEEHKVKGITLDGYRDGEDVLVFKHRLGGGVVLDYGFVENLHTQIGSRVSARVYIIAPAASVAFLEDYIDLDSTRYYILRIPYSIINELHARDFEAITQPVDETQVNDTVQAVGFDFIRQPHVECDYFVRQFEEQLFPEAVVHIHAFKSEALAKGASLKQNLESLSMVFVDLDYPHDPNRKGDERFPPFELDRVFYANQLRSNNWEITIPLEEIGDYIMIIYMDIYGNEYTEIKSRMDFTSTIK
jgi:hypothetical protein